MICVTILWRSDMWIFAGNRGVCAAIAKGLYGFATAIRSGSAFLHCRLCARVTGTFLL